MGAAVETVSTVMQSGIPVARIELLDEDQMEACIRYSKLEGFVATTTLFLEFHGSPASVVEQAEAVEAVARDFGASLRFSHAIVTSTRAVSCQPHGAVVPRPVPCWFHLSVINE